VKLSIAVANKKLLAGREFHEKRLTDNYALRTGVHECLSVIAAFLDRFGAKWARIISLYVSLTTYEFREKR
jgi:hypothetical protein